MAANDSYFAPALSQRLVAGFHAAGGRVDFHVLPAFGEEGHALAEDGGAAELATALDLALGAASTLGRGRLGRR